jgi:outer membrane protein
MNVLGKFLNITLFALACTSSQANEAPSRQQDHQASVDSDPSSDAYWEVEIGILLGLNISATTTEDAFTLNNFKPASHIILAGGYYNGNFFIESDVVSSKPITLGYTAWQNDESQLNLVAMPLFIGFDISKRDVTDSDKRNTSFDVGVELLSSLPYGEFMFSLLHDVSNTHNGYAISANYGYAFRFNKFTFTPTIGVSLVSAKATDYYFGFNANEVNDDLSLYQGGSGLIFRVGFYSEYQLTDNITILTLYRLSQLQDGRGNSALVSKKDNGTFALGAVWTF